MGRGSCNELPGVPLGFPSSDMPLKSRERRNRPSGHLSCSDNGGSFVEHSANLVLVDREEPTHNPDAGGDPIHAVQQAMEEHESELLAELFTEMQQAIPEDATVFEAMIEMRRAMFEEPKTRELAMRVMTLTFTGEGRLREFLPEGMEPPEDPDAYRALVDRDPALLTREIPLLNQLGEEVAARLSPGLTEEEQRRRVRELIRTDPELASLVAELDELAASGSGPPLWKGQGEPGGGP